MTYFGLVVAKVSVKGCAPSFASTHLRASRARRARGIRDREARPRHVRKKPRDRILSRPCGESGACQGAHTGLDQGCHARRFQPTSEAPSRSSNMPVPCSRLPASSYPSRNAPCSVTTSRVSTPSGFSSRVASETEIFRSSRCIT